MHSAVQERQPCTKEGTALISEVKSALSSWIEGQPSSIRRIAQVGDLGTGKLLRTRLASRMMSPSHDPRYLSQVKYGCVATELVHTACLFHDDVIDGASIRRGMPTVWQSTTPNASILLGDLLMCLAGSVLTKTGDITHTRLFMEKVQEVCQAEMEQELILRGNEITPQQCIGIARSKTGPLFAFSALMSAGPDVSQKKAFEEAGYLIGTAYQLADDLIDESSHEETARKTLGTDRLRRKFTLAQAGENAAGTVWSNIRDLFDSALALLENWPQARSGLEAYIECDLEPSISAVTQSRD